MYPDSRGTVHGRDPYMENQPTPLLTRSISKYDSAASACTSILNATSRCSPDGTPCPESGVWFNSHVAIDDEFSRAPRQTPPIGASDGSHLAIPVLVARHTPTATKDPGACSSTWSSVSSSRQPRSEGSRLSYSTSPCFLSRNIRRLLCEIRRCSSRRVGLPRKKDWNSGREHQ